jgi:hypothetical protein
MRESLVKLRQGRFWWRGDSRSSLKLWNLPMI